MSPRATWRAQLPGFCLILALAAHASAEQPMSLRVSGSCPDHALTAAELSPLLRGFTLTDTDTDMPLVATVEDDGDSYRIGIGGARREVRDPSRNCLERARVTAVFLALNLPTEKSDPESPRPPAEAEVAPPPPSDAKSPPPPTPRSQRAFQLRPFASAESAWRADAATSGLGIGGSLRFGSMAVSLLGALTTSTTPYQAQGVAPTFELHRTPLALLLGWEATGEGLFGLGLEAGPALDVLRFEGKEVPHPARALRVNPGLRLNVALRVRASHRLSAELLPMLSWFPRTYLVRVEPARLLAETPSLWVGVSLGLNYEIWGN